MTFRGKKGLFSGNRDENYLFFTRISKKLKMLRLFQKYFSGYENHGTKRYCDIVKKFISKVLKNNKQMTEKKQIKFCVSQIIAIFEEALLRQALQVNT